MNCIRCDKNPPAITRKASCGDIGFCLECWDIIDISGKCKCCGTTEYLRIYAKWFDKVIAHICDYCHSTEECI